MTDIKTWVINYLDRHDSKCYFVTPLFEEVPEIVDMIRKQGGTEIAIKEEARKEP